MGIAYVLFISHPENVVDGGFVSFVVQIITHISDKKSGNDWRTPEPVRKLEHK